MKTHDWRQAGELPDRDDAPWPTSDPARDRAALDRFAREIAAMPACYSPAQQEELRALGLQIPRRLDEWQAILRALTALLRRGDEPCP